MNGMSADFETTGMMSKGWGRDYWIDVKGRVETTGIMSADFETTNGMSKRQGRDYESYVRG